MPAVKRSFAMVLLGSSLTGPAWAHVITNASAPIARSAGEELLGVVLPLAIAAGLYLVGWLRLKNRVELSADLALRQPVAFGIGCVTLGMALLPPLDTLSAQLFSIHMIQHEVLMLIAAPLLVLGRPLPIFLWAFGAGVRAQLGAFTRAKAAQGAWKTMLRPLNAWILHAMALWIWHAPRVFEEALLSQGVHDLQHFIFLGTALLFWSALLHARGRENQGSAVVYLFTTTVHTSVLGALITFASQPWYPAYAATAPLHGLSLLEDQQLGGLIMWVPGSLIYVGIALFLLARWIGVPRQREAPG